MRLGLSPVFIYECLANSRRWQTYALRSIGVAILLASIATIAISHASRFPRNSWRDYAALGESYFYAIIGVELTLVMLAAPAATAGAICVDRARGTLTHMLVTDLTDPEIVLGKLAARLLPVLGLVACTWPVLSICSLLGGIDPTALTLAFAIILAVALLGCTMAMALSVWARKLHEVVLVTYTFWILVLLLWPIWFGLSLGGLVGPPSPWTLVANPYYLANAPYTAPGRIDFWEYLGFFAAMMAGSGVLTILAVWRMRPVASRGNVDDRKEPRLGLVARLRRWLPGPSLDRNPVLWREWHRSRPSRWMMILIVLLGGSSGIACVVGAVSVWANGLDRVHNFAGPSAGILGSVLQVIFGLLMLSAVAPMSMSEERQRGSLDLLATTTLSTRTIVLGKWLGTLRLVIPLAIGPGLMGLALATAHKTPPTIPPGTAPIFYAELFRAELLYGAVLLVATILVHGALIASVGLALATWVKRQSRAIAGCVAAAVMVSGGWPILIGVLRLGMDGQGISCLSPIEATFLLVDLLTTRYHGRRFLLWWTTFWGIECLAVAFWLLWLTIRTFDGCFGRIPERPRRMPILSDVVVALAGLVGVGGLSWAITIAIAGFWGFNARSDGGLLFFTLLVTAGFVLVAALAPLSISGGGTSRVPMLGPTVVLPDRRCFARKWRESFRLVLLLAIGPALIALSFAAVPLPVPIVPRETKLPDGTIERIDSNGSGIIYVMTTDASGAQQRFRNPTAEEIAAVTPARPSRPLVRLLSTAVLAVFTILAHGAAFVSLGLALRIWIKGRARSIAASVCLVLFVTIAWPIVFLIWVYPTYPWGLTLASMPSAFGVLLLHDQREHMVVETLLWVTSWDVFYILLAVVVTALATWTLDRKHRVDPPAGNGEESEAPAVDPGWRAAGGEWRGTTGPIVSRHS